LGAPWKGGAPAYQVELSTDASFVKPLLSQQANDARIALPKPQPGDYWLRVKGVGAEGVAGPASQAIAVKVESFTPWWLLLLLLVP